MEEGTIIPFPESVRTRPAMYLGGRDGRALARIVAGVTRLLAVDGSTLVRITIGAGNKVMIVANKVLLTSGLFEVPQNFTLSLSALPYVCSNLTICSAKEHLAFADGVAVKPADDAATADVMRISFVPDTAVFGNSELHYGKLLENVFELCLHHPQLGVLVRDDRDKYHQQNYLHCPRGIVHLAEEQAAETVGGTYPIAVMEDCIDGVTYKIAATWSHSWNPQPHIACFENERAADAACEMITTTLAGMGDVLRAYIKSFPDKNSRFAARKLRNGLILVAASYGVPDGEWEEKVQLAHNKRVRNFVKVKFLGHVLDNPDFLKFILHRFDTTNPGAIMY